MQFVFLSRFFVFILDCADARVTDYDFLGFIHYVGSCFLRVIEHRIVNGWR